MDERYHIYRIWAPNDALWSQWAKPVLFASSRTHSGFEADNRDVSSWAPFPDGKTALIVDLPGATGVVEGVALTKAGYRPVPLYNGVRGENRRSMAVDVTPIINALYWGAEKLAANPIPAEAPPAFLLDSERMKGTARQPGKYDNRWCVFPHDMPSANFLWEHGIRQIYVRTKETRNDLTHILQRYHEKGIHIYIQEPERANPRKLTYVKPSYLHGLLYRIRTTLGLTRNPAGGFGGMIPEPTQSSGGRYYGVG